MRYSIVKKDHFPKLFSSLQKSYTVYGPARKETQFVMRRVADAAELVLDSIPTILPPKKYLYPARERLLDFSFGTTDSCPVPVEYGPTVLFGLHTCDIAGLSCLGTVLFDDPADPSFAARMKKTLVFGVECLKPCDDKATCAAMRTHVPQAGFDVMLTDAGDRWVVQVNSEEGEAAMKACDCGAGEGTGAQELLAKIREEKQARFTSALKADYDSLAGVFDRAYKSPVWDAVGGTCLSCGNCTNVCPTCYCFDIQDEVALDLSGARGRAWDSCQLEEFAMVAGGENFRKKRGPRQRHRYYRKFSYSMKKYNKYFCTGCGRCTRTCMAGISLIETVNALAEEK